MVHVFYLEGSPNMPLRVHPASPTSFAKLIGRTRRKTRRMFEGRHSFFILGSLSSQPERGSQRKTDSRTEVHVHRGGLGKPARSEDFARYAAFCAELLGLDLCETVETVSRSHLPKPTFQPVGFPDLSISSRFLSRPQTVHPVFRAPVGK